MDLSIIPETSSIKVFRFKFDSSLTWESHIADILSRARQRQANFTTADPC